MERLTRRMCGGWGLMEGCELNTAGGARKIVESLAAYEDTGLTPEEVTALKSIKSYADALEHELEKFMEPEKEGRLILLPCKVTDTVYIIEGIYKRRKQIGEQVVSAQIDHVTIGGTTGKPVFDLCTETGGWFYSMEPDQFYLTREEAERALEIEGGGGQ